MTCCLQTQISLEKKELNILRTFGKSKLEKVCECVLVCHCVLVYDYVQTHVKATKLLVVIITASVITNSTVVSSIQSRQRVQKFCCKNNKFYIYYLLIQCMLMLCTFIKVPRFLHILLPIICLRTNVLAYTAYLTTVFLHIATTASTVG